MDAAVAEVLGNRTLGDVLDVERRQALLGQPEPALVAAEIQHAARAQERVAARQLYQGTYTMRLLIYRPESNGN